MRRFPTAAALTHEAEIKAMARIFADVKTTDEVVAMLASATTAGG